MWKRFAIVDESGCKEREMIGVLSHKQNMLVIYGDVY